MGLPRNMCGARMERRGPGMTCKHAAGWGTDHPGTGACKYHGGCSHFKSGPENPNYKHGLYSKHRSEEEVAEYDKWLTTSGTDLDRLSPEDEFLLFRLERRICRLDTGEAESLFSAARLLDMIADIRLKAQKLRGGEKASNLNVNLVEQVPVAEVLTNERAIAAACDLEAALAEPVDPDAGRAGQDAL